MALSGSFHKYPTSKFGLYCDWTGSQSVTGNYTDVTLNVYLQFYTLQVGSRADSTISINGESETYTAPAINDTSSTSWHMVHLKSKTVRVYHNSNGTKAGVALSASWRFSGTYSGVSIGTITASATVDLNTIDRNELQHIEYHGKRIQNFGIVFGCGRPLAVQLKRRCDLDDLFLKCVNKRKHCAVFALVEHKLHGEGQGKAAVQPCLRHIRQCHRKNAWRCRIKQRQHGDGGQYHGYGFSECDRV